VPGPLRALRLGLARAAKERLNLAIAVPASVEDRHEQEAVLAALPAEGLIVLLDGPRGAVGAAVLERDLLAGLIEQQTIGRVASRAAEPRPFTATDAAIVAPLLEGMLEQMEETLGAQAGAVGLGGFRFGAHIPEARALGLALQAPEYRVFRLTIELAGGARRGLLGLALPWRDVVPAARPRHGMPAQPGLKGVALRVPADLRAVLHRIQMPLSRASVMAPGDVLELPHEVLGKVTLEGPCGQRIARGRLGRVDGVRAVRLVGGQGGAGTDQGAATPEATLAAGEPPATPPPPASPAAPRAKTASPSGRAAGPVASGPAPEVLPDLPPLEFDMPDVPFLPGTEE